MSLHGLGGVDFVSRDQGCDFAAPETLKYTTDQQMLALLLDLRGVEGGAVLGVDGLGHFAGWAFDKKLR